MVGRVPTIGVLGLQGAFREHVLTLQRIGVAARVVKVPGELEGLDGLIIPGGESTTIGLLAQEYGLVEPLRQGTLPIFGTCAGMIMLATDIVGSDQPRLGLMDMRVRRNGFGRQRESFETMLDVPKIGCDAVKAVFIRAPYVEEVGPSVDVLAHLEDRVVLCQSGHHLAASFHPELTDDTRVHRYFAALCLDGKEQG